MKKARIKNNDHLISFIEGASGTLVDSVENLEFILIGKYTGEKKVCVHIGTNLRKEELILLMNKTIEAVKGKDFE